ncbi:hypothetical protein SAMN05216215_106046 [Saccharopolyspora shandongensis]|uniref:Carboxyl transferase domain-containing protein n=1 Tax=Saccharopolyspora shandongensis TaxID=418495 RepID=A0A1H3S4U1_9PSEU|nr:hypothetical protein [Saccharopolyspora shandongensis]SDZ33046.1 hypothetical protein SAMN05216215_106046 [Saccharopolyspora shandongensis]
MRKDPIQLTRDHREEHLAHSAQALATGGERKLAARAEKGELNARYRVARLFDEGSFRETGLFATSWVYGVEDVIDPADTRGFLIIALEAETPVKAYLDHPTAAEKPAVEEGFPLRSNE